MVCYSRHGLSCFLLHGLDSLSAMWLRLHDQYGIVDATKFEPSQ